MRWAGTMPPRFPRSRRWLAAGFLLLVAQAGACPVDEPRPPAPPDPLSPPGTVRVAYPDEPATLNPVTEPSPAARDLLRPILPSFFRITPDLRYEPSLLAEEPEVVPDGEGRGWGDLFSAGRFVLPPHGGDPAWVAGWNRGPPVTAGPYRLEG